jgi:tetratricopeptide (TPR) repeat protein
MALFHDDIAISRGLFVPMTTAASLFGILAALVVAVAVRKKAPIAAFGILFFFAGHVLESTVFPFEIAYEHRNYFPMYGILLALFFCILYPLSYLQNLRMRQAAAFLLIGLFAAGTFSRASAWADPLSFNQAEVEHHPDSPRANSEMGDTYSSLNSEDFVQREMYYFSAAQHYERATQLDKNTTQGLFGFILLNSKREKPVEARWVRELVYRLEHQRNPDHSYKLNNLIACQAEGRCELPKQELEDIVEAPLRNPAVKGHHLANAYTTRNLYLGNIVDDFPGALDALYRAIDAAPNDLHYRLNLINFLMIKGRFDEARTELDKVKQIDKSPTNRAKIESLSKVLAMHG